MKASDERRARKLRAVRQGMKHGASKVKRMTRLNRAAEAARERRAARPTRPQA